MKIRNRKYDSKDFDHVLVIWRISREYSSNGADYAKQHTLYEDITYLRDHILSVNNLWVAENENQEILGFMAINNDFIDCLYIHPDHQDKGIGRSLLQHALKLSPKKIWLHTLADNTRARSYYEHLGFRLISEGKNEEGIPDVTYKYTSIEGKII